MREALRLPEEGGSLVSQRRAAPAPAGAAGPAARGSRAPFRAAAAAGCAGSQQRARRAPPRCCAYINAGGLNLSCVFGFGKGGSAPPCSARAGLQSAAFPCLFPLPPKCSLSSEDFQGRADTVPPETSFCQAEPARGCLAVGRQHRGWEMLAAES